MLCQRTPVPGFIFVMLVTMITYRGAFAERALPETTLMKLLARPFAPIEGASADCARDSRIYIAGLRKYTTWALQMYDASAKISPGIMTGNIKQMGNYDECLRIKTNEEFHTQACSASIQFIILKGSKKSPELDMKDLILQINKASNEDMPIESSVNYEWMWCLPSTCNNTEIGEALELALDPLKVDDRLDFTVNVNVDSCHKNNDNGYNFDVVDWFYTCVISIFLVIVATSTLYDVYANNNAEESKRKGTRYSLLTSFSVLSNGKKLLSTRRSSDCIECLDGIRFLSICWVIFGHTFFLEAVGVKMDRIQITKLHENWSSMLILNGNIVTDAFLLLSGILLSYTCLTKSSKESRMSFNVLSLYLARYVRLTPAYAIVIGFYATLFEKIGTGPQWNTWIGKTKNDCRNSWWTNLLYVNNYVKVDKMCMSQSWYLSVDMQLLWLSPIFLYPMLKLGKIIYFKILTIVGIVLSILLPFFITYFMQLTGTMLYYKDGEDVKDVYLQIYTRVYARAGPYIMGLAFGWLLYKHRDYKIKINPIIVSVGWLMSLMGGSLAVLGPRFMYYNDHPYNRLEASFYAGFHRHLFVLAICWMIFACVNGHGGALNALLSWRAWVPFSKLTYSAYLTHYIVLLYNTASTRTSSDFTTYHVVHAFFGNLTLTLFISFLLSSCLEMPFTTIGRLMIAGDKSRERNNAAESQSRLDVDDDDNNYKAGDKTNDKTKNHRSHQPPRNRQTMDTSVEKIFGSIDFDKSIDSGDGKKFFNENNDVNGNGVEGVFTVGNATSRRRDDNHRPRHHHCINVVPRADLERNDRSGIVDLKYVTYPDPDALK